MKTVPRLMLAAALAGACAASQAHTGHGEHSLFAGLAHPLGADHLLAAVAVGLWSAVALPSRRRLVGPIVFLLALLGGAAGGIALPGLEPALALGVVAFGALLLAPRALPLAAGVALVALAGTLHGLAHGAEGPSGAGFAAYAAGFVASTALLHLGGLALGDVLARACAWAWRVAAGGFGVAGLLLLARV